MIYADYIYYQDVYIGSLLAEDQFDAMAAHASRYIDYYTQNRAKDNAELNEVKMACCALAEQYKAITDARLLADKSIAFAMSNDGEVTAESVGGYSVSRKSGGSGALSAMEAANAAQNALPSIAYRYLANTGLLYRGGCR